MCNIRCRFGICYDFNEGSNVGYFTAISLHNQIKTRRPRNEIRIDTEIVQQAHG